MAAVCMGLRAWGPALAPLAVHDDEGLAVAVPTYWHEGSTFTGDPGWFSPTRRMALAVASTTHPKPRTLEAAAADLVARVLASAPGARKLSDESAVVDGRTARRVRMEVEVGGEPQRIEALVVARGVEEDRVLVEVAQVDAGRLAPLTERILSSVRLSEPAGLAEARRGADANPRSWEPQERLAIVLYRSGDPHGAIETYDPAAAIDPDNPRLVAGRLRVLADYALPEAATEARARVASRTCHDSDDMSHSGERHGPTHVIRILTCVRRTWISGKGCSRTRGAPTDRPRSAPGCSGRGGRCTGRRRTHRSR
jgi:hypothetical protein